MTAAATTSKEQQPVNNPNNRPGQDDPRTNTQPGKRPEEQERHDQGKGFPDRNEQRGGGQGGPGQPEHRPSEQGQRPGVAGQDRRG